LNNSNSCLRISFSKRGNEERSEKFHFAFFKIYFSRFGSGDFDDLSNAELAFYSELSRASHARARHAACA